MKTSKIFFLNKILLVIAISISCTNETTTPTENSNPNIPIDTGSIDGYATVQIGNQIWMAENLKITNAPDGSVLQGVYAYDNNENYVTEYGRLYTWQAAQNACPAGWHLPSLNEWDALIATVGTDPGTKLKVGGSSGFNAKMGGRKSGGTFGYMGQLGLYWTSTTDNPDHAYQKLFISTESGVQSDQTPVDGGS